MCAYVCTIRSNGGVTLFGTDFCTKSYEMFSTYQIMHVVLTFRLKMKEKWYRFHQPFGTDSMSGSYEMLKNFDHYFLVHPIVPSHLGLDPNVHTFQRLSPMKCEKRKLIGTVLMHQQLVILRVSPMKCKKKFWSIPSFHPI